MLVNLFFLSNRSRESQCLSGVVWRKSGKGIVGGGESGKRAKTTLDAGGKSVSEKSQAARTCRNPSRNQKVNRQNFSSVKSMTNGCRRMVLSSSSGDVTFHLTKIILGNL
jgi:hypothetical protein